MFNNMKIFLNKLRYKEKKSLFKQIRHFKAVYLEFKNAAKI